MLAALAANLLFVLAEHYWRQCKESLAPADEGPAMMVVPWPNEPTEVGPVAAAVGPERPNEPSRDSGEQSVNAAKLKELV